MRIAVHSDAKTPAEFHGEIRDWLAREHSKAEADANKARGKGNKALAEVRETALREVLDFMDSIQVHGATAQTGAQPGSATAQTGGASATAQPAGKAAGPAQKAAE